jgi:predicted enzyme related to lactoylglutathione lyase
VHLELHTPDLTLAADFYRGLLGWRPETVLTEGWPYVSLDAGLSGGIVECGTSRAVWVPYAEVRDVDDATRLAAVLGAATLLAPRTGPHGRRSIVRTPYAGELALWQPS